MAVKSKLSFGPWGNNLLTKSKVTRQRGGGGWRVGGCGGVVVGDKQRLRQKGQAVNKNCDILNAIHKVPRYIDGSLLHSQNGCQICSTGIDKVPGQTQVPNSPNSIWAFKICREKKREGATISNYFCFKFTFTFLKVQHLPTPKKLKFILFSACKWMLQRKKKKQ